MEILFMFDMPSLELVQILSDGNERISMIRMLG